MNWTAADLAEHMARIIKDGREIVDIEDLTPQSLAAKSRREREPIGIDPSISGPAKGRVPIPKGMNKTEQSYADHLQQLYLARDILWWGFEAVKVRIGHNCFFSPDFLVMYPDHRLELHDTKGRKGKTYYAEDDAIVKARATSANFPIPMFFVFRRHDGEWETVEM